MTLDTTSNTNGRIHSFESCGTVDGPGLRFVVFMQGCPMRCLYCHNPDTWTFKAGTQYSTDDVLAQILKYKSYMKFSNGGVTISGGEPLAQPFFVKELLQKCKENEIHTVIDTGGYIPLEKVDYVLDYTDLVLLDLKSMNPKIHLELTGCELDKSLDFAKRLQERNIPIWIRHVLVPGITDNKHDLQALADFAKSLTNAECIELLPFHKMGEYKWEEMGLEYELSDVTPPTRSQINEALDILETSGLEVKV